MSRPPSLTPAQQKEIARRLEAGETQRNGARSYNVSQSTISRLLRRFRFDSRREHQPVKFRPAVVPASGTGYLPMTRRRVSAARASYSTT